MLVSKEIVNEFANLFLELAKSTAKLAHRYIGEHDRINGYYKYPVRMKIFPRTDPRYSHLFDEIPFLVYDIPKYCMDDYPKDKILYSAIFNGYNDDCVDCTTLNEFDILINYISSEPELKKIICKEDDSLIFKIKRTNVEIVERYLYMTNATSHIPEDLDDKMRNFVSERLLRFVAEKLDIDIIIPICLATFEDDEIKLSDHIEIKRMSEEIQKSRQQACSYEASNEDWVAACATHMIVIHNYQFKNKGDNSINSATKNYNSYPLKEIDMVISAIKVVTGYSIGYAQILSRPIEWIDGFCADLIPLYGAKAHFVNPQETEKFWAHLPVSYISHDQSNKLRKVHQSIIKCAESQDKSNLIFSLNRFNRCMLRNEKDDMATDATIGIEALLSGGTKGEISYTISNRIPVVFVHEQNELYTPSNSRVIMKKIYNYRSKDVHGGKMKENDKVIEINGNKYDVAEVAVDFLRYSLLFMLDNQKFLDAKKIDEYMDSVISGKLPESKNE